jgi:hypothetical protein
LCLPSLPFPPYPHPIHTPLTNTPNPTQANTLTEPLFTSALQSARALDTYFATHNQTIGPLHGIPITLKDQFNVKGVDTTLGYVGRAFKPAEEDAVLVKILKGLGAVVVAKTALPQSIMVCFISRFPFSSLAFRGGILGPGSWFLGFWEDEGRVGVGTEEDKGLRRVTVERDG